MIAEQAIRLPRELSVELWDREYRDRLVIPSSSRVQPAKAFTLFERMGAFDGGGHVLDAGCGNGRNAVYLAKLGWDVTAIDASPAAVERASRLVVDSNLEWQVSVGERVLADKWTYDDSTFDLVVDSYVLCHYADVSFIDTYLSEIRRVLKPGGIVYSAHFSTSDSYYDTVGVRDSICDKLVIDPNNGLHKRLYDMDELSQLLGGYFRIEAKVDYRFDDICLGHKYERSVLAFLMRT
jgi:SAM-dependent methyltransferase